MKIVTRNLNNTPDASRKLCAPPGVTFFVRALGSQFGSLKRIEKESGHSLRPGWKRYAAHPH